jgi:uncharacterized protein YndB with AHSA1/START domain
MIDVLREIESVQREVGTSPTATGEGHAIRLRRTYDTPIEDLWDALTNPERISRWFLPISGDYRIGGHYQLTGNAGGKILACERPNRFRVTWVYGEPATPGDVSELEIRLKPEGQGTTLELEHIAVVPDEFWEQYGPGAVGVGWDQGLLGLTLHLSGGTVGDPIAWQVSDEGLTYATRSSERWGAASEAAGEDPAKVAAMVANTTAFYTTVPEGDVPS